MKRGRPRKILDPSNPRHQFAQNLRELFDSKGFTHVRAANAIGVPTGTLHNWLAGYQTPHFKHLCMIALAFNVPLSDLVKGI